MNARDHADEVSILLVDDRPANLLALKAMLECEGYRFVLAESGEQALAQIAREDFGLVLLDVAMPGMDGFETAARIKQMESARQLPIIFVTAYMKELEAVAKSYASGGVDYLLKPLDVATVR